MKTIGAFSAKTHLSAMLGQVAQGQSFLITKRGKPMACLLYTSGHDVVGKRVDIRGCERIE